MRWCSRPLKTHQPPPYEAAVRSHVIWGNDTHGTAGFSSSSGQRHAGGAPRREFRGRSSDARPRVRVIAREGRELGAFGYPMAALYLHYEEASPEFTMKCAATADACSTTSACSAATRSAATRPRLAGCRWLQVQAQLRRSCSLLRPTRKRRAGRCRCLRCE
jgi:hypothetical protein